MAKKHISKKVVSEDKCCSGLDCNKVALSLGFLCGFYMLVLAILSGALGMGSAIVHLLSSLYVGYDATFLGALAGMLWGFLDGYIAGYLFSWVYTKMSKCC